MCIRDSNGSIFLAQGAQVGHQRIHPTHRGMLHEATGTYFCPTCGCVGVKLFDKLAKPCGFRVTPRYGRANLRRLEKGQRPGEAAHAKAFNEGLVKRVGPRFLPGGARRAPQGRKSRAKGAG